MVVEEAVVDCVMLLVLVDARDVKVVLETVGVLARINAVAVAIQIVQIIALVAKLVVLVVPDVQQHVLLLVEVDVDKLVLGAEQLVEMDVQAVTEAVLVDVALDAEENVTVVLDVIVVVQIVQDALGVLDVDQAV